MKPNLRYSNHHQRDEVIMAQGFLPFKREEQKNAF